MSWPVLGANQLLMAQFNVRGPTGVFGGLKMGVNLPSGAKFIGQIYGQGTGASGPCISTFLNTNTLSPLNFAVGTTGPVDITGVIVSAQGVTGTGQIVAGTPTSGITGVFVAGGSVIVFPSN